LKLPTLPVGQRAIPLVALALGVVLLSDQYHDIYTETFLWVTVFPVSYLLYKEIRFSLKAIKQRFKDREDDDDDY